MNSKAKGNSFERDVCRKLSEWLTGKTDELICWRSASSGATSTINFKLKKNKLLANKHAGDIVSIVEKGVYEKVDTFFNNHTVECKHYKEVDFYPPFNGSIRSFFESCIEEKGHTGKSPVLIVKGNNRKVLYFEEVMDEDETLLYPITIRHKDMILHGMLFDDKIKGIGSVVKKQIKTLDD